jgi:hypothetical protein
MVTVDRSLYELSLHEHHRCCAALLAALTK